MRVEGVKVVRVLRSEDEKAWEAALTDGLWLDASRMLKSEGDAWVRRLILPVGGEARDVVMKCHAIPGAWEKAKSALGFGRGERHWNGAALLAMKKVRTARPLALARAVIDSSPCELLVMETLEGPTLLQVMDDITSKRSAQREGVTPSPSLPGSGSSADKPLPHRSVRVQHAIARAVGRTVWSIVSGGAFNRDHKPSNIIVTRAEPGVGDTAGAAIADVAVIDCVGVRERRGPIDGGPRGGPFERMLASLVIEAIGCGCPPRRALMMRTMHAVVAEARAAGLEEVAARAWIRQTWYGVDRVVRMHGDPRPRTNPLAHAAA